MHACSSPLMCESLRAGCTAHARCLALQCIPSALLLAIKMAGGQLLIAARQLSSFIRRVSGTASLATVDLGQLCCLLRVARSEKQQDPAVFFTVQGCLEPCMCCTTYNTVIVLMRLALQGQLTLHRV